jgi:hypothetical protein
MSSGTAAPGSTANVYERGVRVKNGKTLPSGGLSVVSQNPVYVQGDFNTTGAWQPGLIAGDAINVLSNAWSDANATATSTTAPSATATTINAAFLSGNVPTVNTYGTSENYSGGVENFPRFHENWNPGGAAGQITFTYNGSMVQMFQSQQGTGRWSKANYSAPKRAWAWDSRFVTQPPPGTLLTTSYSRGQWFLK